MLNVSTINSVPNVDNRYQNITILSRPPPQTITGQSSGQSSGQPCVSLNTKSGFVDQQLDCVDNSNSIESSTPSMSSLPSDTTNGSQSLRSTVLANNAITGTNDSNGSTDSNGINGNPNVWTTNGDKSPMCRINEISRFNDIKHEYHLIEESGPPHNKTFTVILKLGENEEFRGSGPSIKKAQRSAATIALQQTKLKEPTPRVVRHNKDGWLMTPTVELNMLAMKLGQNAVYQVYEPPRHQAPAFSFGPLASSQTATNAYDYRGMHYQRYHLPRGPFSASLTVGSRQFIGKGHTAQAARHAAAEEALKVLRQLVVSGSEVTACASEQLCEGSQSGDNSVKSPISLVHEMALKRNLCVRFDVIDESGPSHMPKFVTQCTVGHIVTTGEGNAKKVSKKMAAIRMMEELNKLQPTVGSDISDISAEQSAVHKRSSTQTTHKKNMNKKRNTFGKNSVKEKTKQRNVDSGQTRSEDKIIDSDVNQTKCDSSADLKQNGPNTNGVDVSEMSGVEGAAIHPINRLIQLQQARKEKAPQFTLMSERVIDRRRREFTIECTIQVSKGGTAQQTVSSLGLGANKKVAKKNAAEQMLQLLGYSSRAPTSPQSILKQDSTEGQTSQHKKIRQVKFIEDDITTNSSLVDMSCGANQLSKLGQLGRQLVPGLILMPSDICGTTGVRNGSDFDCNTNSKPNNSESIAKKMQSISSVAKELLDSNIVISHKKCQSEDIEGSPQLSCNSSEQLKSVAKTVGSHQLQVHFSDFPRKQNNGHSIEYLSVVTITTVWNPTPIVSHGSGLTVEEARNQASHQALIHLSQLDTNG